MRRIKLIIAAVFLISPFAANAEFIVNTGTPVVDWATWSFRTTQYFAGEFTIVDPYSISSVESYFSNAGDGDKIDTGAAGNVAISIHVDGGNVPGASLFSTTLGVDQDAALDWYGAFGLDWLLDAGTYWLSFIPDPNISGIMPGLAPNPLDEYAQGNSGVWGDFGPDNYDFVQIGFRINATVVAVPEPGTLALFGIGLFGMALARSRKALA